MAIAEADRDDETQLLRLESDAHRVQIVTLHKSKGLEYPLVFLPFVGIGGNGRNDARHHAIHDGARRMLHWKIDKASQAWKDACARHAEGDVLPAKRPGWNGHLMAVTLIERPRASRFRGVPRRDRVG